MTDEDKPKKRPAKWGRLSPQKNKKSKLGRLTNIYEEQPEFLTPLRDAYEKVSPPPDKAKRGAQKIENVETKSRGTQGKKEKKKRNKGKKEGEWVLKPPKEWAFGAWDIESHCYEHVCPSEHREKSCNIPGCQTCHECPACNPEHGEHWISAQLSILRIPDQYIDYVKGLDESELFGGTRQEEGRYVEFLNSPQTCILRERARCVAPGGCIDRTLRFLMNKPCFFQKAKLSKGYIVKGEHTPRCTTAKHKKKGGSLCSGCARKPYAPGAHTTKCRHRDFRKKDGTPCGGCSTLSTAWYSHFGGGYDINFALRWLSEHGSDFEALKKLVESADENEREILKSAIASRYQYKAESLLAGATHIQVKLYKLAEVYKKKKPTKKQLATIAKESKSPRLGSSDYWLKGYLERGLLPGGDLCDVREAQETLNLVMKSRLQVTGEENERTEKAIRGFQKKCAIHSTGRIDRETSAALRYLRSMTTREPNSDEVILLRDSFRLVGSGLSDAAKDFQLTHPVTGKPLRKIDDIDVTNPPPPDDPEYRRYCRFDTEICVQLVMTFNKLITQLGGTLEMTSSSCAVTLFRRKYLKDRLPRHRHMTGCKMLCKTCGTETCSKECGVNHRIEPGKNQERHLKLLKKHKKSMHKLCPTYPIGCFHFAALGKNGHRHGGHVDVLRQRLDKGRCYDVNSLYPFAMLGPVPVGHMQRYVNLSPEEKKTEKYGSPLAVAAYTWEAQKKKVIEKASRNPITKNLIEKHGLDFATLEETFRVGADRGPDTETGAPFDDPNFDKIDSFKRIRKCGYVEAIVSIPQDDRVPESYFPPLPIVRDTKNDEGKNAGEILFLARRGRDLRLVVLRRASSATGSSRCETCTLQAIHLVSRCTHLRGIHRHALWPTPTERRSHEAAPQDPHELHLR